LHADLGQNYSNFLENLNNPIAMLTLQMEIPVDIANRIKPELDAAAHSHVFRELRETEDPVTHFDLPSKSKEYPLITWTQVKVGWENDQLTHAYMRIMLVSDAMTVPMSPPIAVQRNTWTALEWLLPAIPLANYRIAIQVELDPLHVNHYVQLRVLGFEQLLDRNSDFLFVNEEEAPKWHLSNCDNGAYMYNGTGFQGMEGTFVTLKPLAA